MPRFSQSARVPYSAAEAFDLVSDVARYPDFIRWITAMRVSDTSVDDAGCASCLADSDVGFRGFTERFATRVVADPSAGRVRASLVRGPFKTLQAQWDITRVSDNVTDIGLTIEYEFKSRIISLLAAANQEMAARRILKAFLDEAERRFGRAPG
jgi:coenzyme Q-binding protein COQ10